MKVPTSVSVFERRESAVRSYCRSFPAVFTSARGSLMEDEGGGTYIDFLCGSGSLNYGHNHPVLKRKLLDYLEGDGIVHGLDLYTAAKGLFMETFERVILEPRGLDYRLQFPGPTGTNANEAALKLARLVKERSTILAFSNSFHGVTAGSLSVTGNAFFRNEVCGSRQNVVFMPFDGRLGEGVDTLAVLRKAVEDRGSGIDAPAAVIVETVQAEGGVNVARREWLRGLWDLCRELDLLLIVDDIQAGIGRTGPFFSFEEAGIVPDIVTLSKSLSGYGLPLSMVLIRPEIDRWKPGEHSGTFRGNTPAFVTAAESLNLYWRTDELTGEVLRKGRRLAERLESARGRHPGLLLSVRGRGMLYGLLTGSGDLSQRISREAFDRGLLVERCGAREEVLKVSPPLNIEDDLLHKGLDILEGSIAAVAEEEERTNQ